MHTLVSQFRTSTHVLNLSLANLSDSAARARARGDEGPSITWTVGHLLDARHKMLALLGATQDNPWAAQFGKTPATGGADYPTVAIMLIEWASLHETLEAACVARASQLDNPTAAPGAHGESKVRDQLAFLAWHEGYHIGVIGAARKAAGLPGPAELVRAAQPKA